jgi:hypothetical protein
MHEWVKFQITLGIFSIYFHTHLAHLYVRIRTQAIVTGVALIALMVFYVSTWDVTHAVNKTEAGFMGVAFRHVAGGMEPLLEANRAAVAIAGAAQEDPTTSNGSAPDSISQVLLRFHFRRDQSVWVARVT